MDETKSFFLVIVTHSCNVLLIVAKLSIYLSSDEICVFCIEALKSEGLVCSIGPSVVDFENVKSSVCTVYCAS